MKTCVFPWLGTVLEVRVIRFDLRPDFLGDVLLESIVPGEAAADLGLFTGRKGCSKCSLNIKSTEAFPVGDRWSDDRLRGPVLILARGECCLEERRKNVMVRETDCRNVYRTSTRTF